MEFDRNKLLIYQKSLFKVIQGAFFQN